MSTFLADLRYGVRMIAKQPAVSIIAIFALALGIGLTTTMYSIVHGAIRDLPFEESYELLFLEQTNPSLGIDDQSLNVHDYLDWQAQQTTFDDLGAFYQGTIAVAGSERPVRYEGAFMTAEVFALLGADAMLGRTIGAADGLPGADPVLVLSHEVWANQYQSDPGVIGREVRINGRPGAIVGVMPAGFRFPMIEEAWSQIEIDTATLERGQGRTYSVLGRLRDGVPAETAFADLQRISEGLEAEHPETNKGDRAIGRPFVREYMNPQSVTMLWTMQGAVFLVLMIACANVANLLLSRALERSREVAVRSALGASRRRIVAQMLTEALVLALVGGVVGIAIARAGIALFNAALGGIQVPFWIVVELDWQVMAFGAVIVLAAALLAGVMPAWQVTGANLNDILKDETRGSSSFRLGRVSRVLVIAEVAFSCGLLVGAGLMIKSVVQLGSVDYGFPTDVMTARVALFQADYPEVEQRREFFDELRRRLQGRPEVDHVALAGGLPGTYYAGGAWVTIEGETYATPEERPLTRSTMIAPGFFETFEAAPLQGRDFGDEDQAGSLPVAIVNASFAARYFPGENPLGRRFGTGLQDPDRPWLTVVGVVPDLYMQGVGNPGLTDPAGFYLPLSQSDPQFVSVAVRGLRAPEALVAPLREEVAALDVNLPIYWVQQLQAEIHANTWFYRVFGGLFMVFGAAALFLAVIGLYGVMSFAVGRRTHEVGIRMALGAERRDVLSLVMRNGLWQVVAGLILGVGVAMLGAGGLEMVLFQVDPRDITVYGLIVATLGAAGLLACLVPAGRASRIDPIVALRSS